MLPLTILLCTLNAQDLTIRTRVPLVVAPTSVTTLDGRFVNGLSASDFTVLDNGKPQRVMMDTQDIAQIPISIVIAVQSNAMSSAALAKIRKVGSMIEPLITGERGEVAVLVYADAIRTLQDFTSSNVEIAKAFQAIKTRGDQARTLDAASQAITMLAARPPGRRKVILLISESRDRGSETKLPDLLRAAQREDVTIYPLTYSVHATPWIAKPSDAPPADGGFNILAVVRELARLGSTNAAEELGRFTGGRHLSFLTLNALEKGLTHLGEELHSQYLLSYTPSEQSGDTEFHTLEIRVKDRAGVVVQSRPGYWPAN